MCVRTNEEIYQRKCVMKREMRKNHVMMLAEISVRVIYDSNQMKVNICIKPVISNDDKQWPRSCYQTGSSRSNAGLPHLSGSIRLSAR